MTGSSDDAVNPNQTDVRVKDYATRRPASCREAFSPRKHVWNSPDDFERLLADFSPRFDGSAL
jgi:hypothetical protein